MKILAVVEKNQNCKFNINLLLIFLVNVLCVEGSLAPRFLFGGNSFFSEPSKPIPGPEKKYTGIRISQRSIITIYDYDQTIAIVERDPNYGEILSCELLEVRTYRDKVAALNQLQIVNAELKKLNLLEMLDLMKTCQQIDVPIGILSQQFINNEAEDNISRRRNRHVNAELFSLLSGIVPGTKWCGLGDKAGSYYDLGRDKSLDKCCRTHDFCPSKITAFRRQYNIINYSYATKSHCRCDEEFYSCLKAVNSSTSNLVGSIYFGTISCLESASNDPSDTNKIFVNKVINF